ncbi:shikimate dehydrogenase [Methanosalsum natronophilum]|uniref:Shikimate dehydrogenase (NADP(+)) n=1 Tax=Methanosalsum natronophilum TaxID=768733 RepID=A0A3R7X7B1_9EURY|nr:shikimate dehydrogenase [Methanosalsum natronophilum]MCS3923551.1 shikimate dehydrogenase [Methanosalsum natronophilum]RQD87863.1 MAG: shikimate dehydrogenase [Methanosalsum natronophilum]
MKTVFGVFGDPVKHSMSPKMHNAAFKDLGLQNEYHAFRVKPNDLLTAVKGAEVMGFGGINLTVPHKEGLMEHINIDPIAKRIGAINTIDFKNGIYGYNTDGIGALNSLKDENIAVKGSTVVIVGAGGAARAISFQLAEEGASIRIVNRNKDRAVSLGNDLKDYADDVTIYELSSLKSALKNADILINTTTVGMVPNLNETIATQNILRSDLTVFDIVYNPVETKLLKEAKKAGAKTISGVMMLVYQGAEAFRIWTGTKPPIQVMKKAVMEELNSCD